MSKAAEVCTEVSRQLRPVDLSGKLKPCLAERLEAFKLEYSGQLEQACKVLAELKECDLRQQILFGTALVKAAELHLRCAVNAVDQMAIYGLDMFETFEGSRDKLGRTIDVCVTAVDLAKQIVVKAIAQAAKKAIAEASDTAHKLVAAMLTVGSCSMP